MFYVMSRKQMLLYLDSLRTILNELNRSMSKIIFINSLSFYHFIKSVRIKNGMSVEELLNEIEQFIPFPIDEDGLNLLISGLLLPESERDGFQDELSLRAKADFAYSVKNVTNSDQWDLIVSVCDSLRRIRESEAAYV